MAISLDSIVSLLGTKKVEFTIEGRAIDINVMAAIGQNVRNALCYYVGFNPDHLIGIQDSIIICRPGMDLSKKEGNTFLLTNHPQLAYYYASSLFMKLPKPGIHTYTEIDPNAKIGSGISVGPFCHIGNCTIGNGVVIESGVKIHDDTLIGDGVWIQANTDIGAMGVMWARDERGGKVPCVQTGHVVVEDDVLIGSNITIARGAFENRPTVIGAHTMIAHGTMIGHGSKIGPGNHFANNISIAGSVETGPDCFFGSGAVVRPHIIIPPSTTVGAGAVVVKNFNDAGLTLIGNPAGKYDSKRKTASGVPAPFSIEL